MADLKSHGSLSFATLEKMKIAARRIGRAARHTRLRIENSKRAFVPVLEEREAAWRRMELEAERLEAEAAQAWEKIENERSSRKAARRATRTEREMAVTDHV